MAAFDFSFGNVQENPDENLAARRFFVVLLDDLVTWARSGSPT